VVNVVKNTLLKTDFSAILPTGKPGKTVNFENNQGNPGEKIFSSATQGIQLLIPGIFRAFPP